MRQEVGESLFTIAVLAYGRDTCTNLLASPPTAIGLPQRDRLLTVATRQVILAR